MFGTNFCTERILLFSASYREVVKEINDENEEEETGSDSLGLTLEDETSDSSKVSSILLFRFHILLIS